jgi:hypothetical protein
MQDGAQPEPKPSGESVDPDPDPRRDRMQTFVAKLRDVMLAQPRIDHDDAYVGLKEFGASSIDIEIMCDLKVFSYAEQVEAR